MRMPQTTTKKKQRKSSSAVPYVMTLAEAARFLKLPVKTVERLASEGELPGRKIGKEWRFLRTAIERWLAPNARSTVLSQFGALKDDPTYAEYRKILEANRQRLDEEVA
jgi:excisionase family DNA binding protein